MKKLIELHGTAATLDIEIGFAPDLVRIINEDDRTELEITRRELTLGTWGRTRAANGDHAQAANAAAGIVDFDGGAPTETDPADVETDAYGNQIFPTDATKIGIEVGANATVNHAADHLLVIAETIDDVVDAR